MIGESLLATSSLFLSALSFYLPNCRNFIIYSDEVLQEVAKAFSTV